MPPSSLAQGYSTGLPRIMIDHTSQSPCHSSISSLSSDSTLTRGHVPIVMEAGRPALDDGKTSMQDVDCVDRTGMVGNKVEDFSGKSRIPPSSGLSLRRSGFTPPMSSAFSDQEPSAHLHVSVSSSTPPSPLSLVLASMTIPPPPLSSPTSFFGGRICLPSTSRMVSNSSLESHVRSTQGKRYGVCKRKHRPWYRFSLRTSPQNPAADFGEAHPCLYPRAARNAQRRVEEDEKDEAEAEFVLVNRIKTKKPRKPVGTKKVARGSIVQDDPKHEEKRSATDSPGQALARSISACIEEGALRIFDAYGRLVVVDKTPSSTTFNRTDLPLYANNGATDTPVVHFAMEKTTAEREALLNIRYDSQRTWSMVHGETASSSALVTPSPSIEVGRVVAESYIRESFSSVTAIPTSINGSPAGLADRQALEDKISDSDSSDSFQHVVHPFASFPLGTPISPSTDIAVSVHDRGRKFGVALGYPSSQSAITAPDTSHVAQEQSHISETCSSFFPGSEDVPARSAMDLGRIRTSSILARRSRRGSFHVDPHSTAHIATDLESPDCESAHNGHAAGYRDGINGQEDPESIALAHASHEIFSSSPANEEQRDVRDIERKDSTNPEPPSRKLTEAQATTIQLLKAPEEVPQLRGNSAILLEQAGRAAQAGRRRGSVSSSSLAGPSGDGADRIELFEEPEQELLPREASVVLPKQPESDIHDISNHCDITKSPCKQNPSGFASIPTAQTNQFKVRSSFETARSRYEEGTVSLQTPSTTFKRSDKSVSYFDTLEAASIDHDNTAQTSLQLTLEQRLTQYMNEQLEKQMATRPAESMRTWVPDSFFEAGALLVWYKPEKCKEVMLSYYDWAMEMRRLDPANQYYYDWYLDIKTPSQSFNNAVRCILRNPGCLAKLLTSMLSPDEKRETLAGNRVFLESTAWFQLSIDKPCNNLPIVVHCDVMASPDIPMTLSEPHTHGHATSGAENSAYDSARDGMQTPSSSIPEVHIVDLGLELDDQEEISTSTCRPGHLQAVDSYSSNRLDRTTTEKSPLAKWDSGWSPQSANPQQQKQGLQPAQQEFQPQQQQEQHGETKKHHQAQAPPQLQTPNPLSRLGIPLPTTPTKSDFYNLEIRLDDDPTHDVPTRRKLHPGTPPRLYGIFGPGIGQVPAFEYKDMEYIRQMGHMGAAHDNIRDKLMLLIEEGVVERRRLGVRRRSRMRFEEVRVEVREGIGRVLGGSFRGMVGLNEVGWMSLGRRGKVVDAGYAFAAGHV